MQFVRKSLEVVRSSESAIELASIGDPIAMVRVTVGSTGALVVLRDGADPDCAYTDVSTDSQTLGAVPLTGSEPCILDVVEVLANGVPCTTTECLVAWVALGRVSTLGEGITVHNDSGEKK